MQINCGIGIAGLTDIALSEVEMKKDISSYEKGFVMNFLEHVSDNGEMPIMIMPDTANAFGKKEKTNIHKPNIAQHALYIAKKYNDFEWLSQYFSEIERFIGFYEHECKH